MDIKECENWFFIIRKGCWKMNIFWYFCYLLIFVSFTVLCEELIKTRNIFFIFLIFVVILLPLIGELLCYKLKPKNLSYLKNISLRFSAILIATIINIFIYYSFIFTNDFSIDAEQILISLGIIQTIEVSLLLKIFKIFKN
jgi:hypothetical protein